MASVKEKLTYLAAAAVPIYLWAKLLKHYLQLKKRLVDKTKIHYKHNCVITYSKEDGMFGWPEYPERLALNLESYQKFLEPILFFIETAKFRLDISVMILTCNYITDSLKDAAERGVQVRLILDAGYDDMKPKMKVLSKKGVKVMYDQKFINADTMMHNKYAVKDFDITNGSGYSLCGSLNWTQSAFTENYEFMVLSSNRQVVGAFNKNFEETWEFLMKVKETNLLNETLYQL